MSRSNDRPMDVARPSTREGLETECFLRKEVIQPQVLLQLPCYDFTPIAEHTMDGCLPAG